MFQNNERAAMLWVQINPVEVELFSYLNNFFCSNKFAKMLAAEVKTLCRPVRIIFSEAEKNEKNINLYIILER